MGRFYLTIKRDLKSRFASVARNLWGGEVSYFFFLSSLPTLARSFLALAYCPIIRPLGFSMTSLTRPMRKPPLINDTDWPEFDQDFHDLIIFGVTKDLLPSVGKTSAGDRHRQTYRDRMHKFRAEMRSRPASVLQFADVQSAAGLSNLS